MKKGFTLIELLAVIVILGFILAIAIPRIVSLVDDARIKAYISNEDMLLRGTRNYIAVNESLLPANIGGTIEVSVNHLIAESYMTEIKNPYNRNENCNGYVTVTKINNTEYDYTPHIKCGLDIHSGSDDGLVAHYKFDDFQEPTENLMFEYVEYFNGRPFVAVHHGNGHEISSEVAPIFNNVPVYKTWDNGEDTQDMRFPFRFNLNNIDLWDRDVTFSIYIYLPSEFAGRYSHFSSFAFQNTAGSDWHSFRGYHESSNYYGAGTVRMHFSGLDVAKYDEWQRVSITFKPLTENKHLLENNGSDNNSQVGGYFKVHVPTHLNNPYHMYVTAPQLEIKNYTTPFVKNVREGTILDHYGNGNNAILSLSNTPKWTNESKIGNGAYEFSGNNEYIPVSPLNIDDDITISLWINRKGSTNTFAPLVEQGGTRRFRLIRMHNRFCFGNDSLTANFYCTDSLFSNTNTWYHVVASVQSNNYSVFVNGINYSLTNITGSYASWVTNQLNIGYRPYDYSVSAFNGIIDDIRVYSRGLSVNEIKQLYDSQK